MTVLLRSFHSCCVKVRKKQNVWSCVAHQKMALLWRHNIKVTFHSSIADLRFSSFVILPTSHLLFPLQWRQPALRKEMLLMCWRKSRPAGCLSSLLQLLGNVCMVCGLLSALQPSFFFSPLTLIYWASFSSGSLTGSHFDSVITKKRKKR